MPKRPIRQALLASVLVLAAAGAAAQTFYKWIDTDGKVHYSDVPPKNFKGEVIRLEVEPEKSAVPATARSVSAEEKAPVQDIAAKRRAERERLTALLDVARGRVDAARKALEGSSDPTNDERQVIQARGAAGGQHGMADRNNCRKEKDKAGHDILMCPTSIPTSDYFDRIAKLEENLRKAEEDLAAAEQAFRRGVD